MRRRSLVPPRVRRSLVPPRVRRSFHAARTLWESGMLAQPRLLVEQWRHRADAATLRKALFYHRYASALFLAQSAGVLEALHGGATSVEEVATRCSIAPRAAHALLRILESQRVVDRRGDRYQLTEFASSQLVARGPMSSAPLLELMAAQAAAFPEVVAGLRTGAVPAALDIFDEGGRYQAFLDAVNGYLHWAALDLLRHARLPPVRDFIVGSMGVSFSARVLERFPEARVTYGCLEHLVREVPRLRRDYGVDEARVAGTHSHGGDPSADRWGDEAFDLVFLTKKMILEPEQRIGEKFAAKAFQVLRPGGAAVFWETVHADRGPTPLARAMEAVLDLAASPHGPVHTESDLRAMLGGIGYRDIELVPALGGQTTFVVARR